MTRLAVIGDIAILLLFAAIGRASHDESGGVLVIVGVAAPFLAGWFLAAWQMHPYDPAAFHSMRSALIATVRTWIPGCIIGLIIRSIAEWHVTPITFVVIALVFNGVLLCVWHAALARVSNLKIL